MAAIVAMFTATVANAIPARPEPPRLVNDFAGIFSYAQTQALENELVEFDDTTTNQIAVITTLDLEGYDIAEYATRIGLEWQVGSEKFDNGVVIVVKPKTRSERGEVFIAVGYGLEGAIPDITAKRIIDEIVIPHFMGDDYFGGVADACTVIMKLASGEISELREGEDDIIWAVIGIFIIILFVIFIVAAVSDGKNGGGQGTGGRGPVIYTGPIIRGGNSFGGFGGGSSGGFGGFGGGSFGGGGARGSW